VQQDFGSLDAYLRQFVDGRPKITAWNKASQILATTPEAEAMSKALKSRGFKFVGPTIC
jgi:DNA-3-methyladenine glycosylase I